MADRMSKESEKILATAVVRRFRQALGQYADGAMLEYARMHIFENEHEALEQMAKNEPDHFHLLVMHMAAAEPEGLTLFLQVSQQAIEEEGVRDE